ncbi:hypothetical protein GOBAR_AA25823 [Gossypium barbadense]|uniref:Uncharacterized protein n=1 Tax=Gossypium barbadense TaxID=3634 RepID=A0A2P5WUR9_GOSBA|nr:hypothetical protein GOBAR_AA25823 [Gossypium barbadense]
MEVAFLAGFKCLSWGKEAALSLVFCINPSSVGLDYILLDDNSLDSYFMSRSVMFPTSRAHCMNDRDEEVPGDVIFGSFVRPLMGVP